jgi:hypothetical protein
VGSGLKNNDLLTGFAEFTENCYIHGYDLLQGKDIN